MSWGVSKRLKKILGFVDAPMENEVPGYLQGAEDPNKFTNIYSSGELPPIKPLRPEEFKKPENNDSRPVATSEATNNAVNLNNNVGENRMNNGSVNRITPKGPRF